MTTTAFLSAPTAKVTAKSAERIKKSLQSKRPALLAKVPSMSKEGVGYDVRKGADGNIYCTCPAWRFQRKPLMERTCKHIKALSAAIRSVA
jgi:hypothetical protein